MIGSHRWLTLALLMAAPLARAATFGTLVPATTLGDVAYLNGGASDLVLDETHGRLYLINPTQSRIEVYDTKQKQFVSFVVTDSGPVAAALSADSTTLYVVCQSASTVNVVDVTGTNLSVTRRVSLSAQPQGVAAGRSTAGIEKVLITTASPDTPLLLFQPAVADSTAVQAVTVPAPPAASSSLPAATGDVSFAPRSNAIASADRKTVTGFLVASATGRTAFVYDVDSGLVSRTRTVNDTATVLSISPDSTKFMAGARLFETSSLRLIAQQSAANLPYLLSGGATYNTAAVQGGSVFSPDGTALYSAFNFGGSGTATNVTQLTISNPANLLTSMGLQMPDNLAGKMVISSDGATIYALSDSGFVMVPIGNLSLYPVAALSTRALSLAWDLCDVTSSVQSGSVTVSNPNGGQIAVLPRLMNAIGASSNLPPLMGGSASSSSLSVLLQAVKSTETAPTGVYYTTTPSSPTAVQRTMLVSAPSLITSDFTTGSTVTFSYNQFNTRLTGSIPPHDFQFNVPLAVNVPPQLRVYQNFRAPESTATVHAVTATSPAGGEGLTDMALDSQRKRIYVANSGMNRIEVFSLSAKTFGTPITVGQLPRSVALSPDGGTLWVANSGGESIMAINPDTLAITQTISFPALPLSTTASIATPAVITATTAGPQILMSNGSLWRIVDGVAQPRGLTVTMPATMAATPGGEKAILLAGDGMVYLYDASADDFTVSKQVFSSFKGYYGPVTAAPAGAYYVANGTVLDSALNVVSTTPTVLSSGLTYVRPVAAVAAVSASQYLRFVNPLTPNSSTLPITAPAIELTNASSGGTAQSYNALETPLSTVVGNKRVNVDGRWMVVDSTNSIAYVLTMGGLSEVPLAAPAASTPVITSVLNTASQATAVSPGVPVSIMGSNLGPSASVTGSPYSTSLGKLCVTLGKYQLPMNLTSSSQINGQVPWEITPGTYSLVVHNLDSKVVSAASTVTVSEYSPAVLMDSSGLAMLYHRSGDDDGAQVTSSSPAQRDEELYLYAVGLGKVEGVQPVTGEATTSSVTGSPENNVYVFFDDPSITESAVIVKQTTLREGLVGVYRIRVKIPWDRRRGDALKVYIKTDEVWSPKSGSIPTVAVN